MAVVLSQPPAGTGDFVAARKGQRVLLLLLPVGGNWGMSVVEGEVGAPRLCPAPTSPVSWPNSSSVPSFVPLLALIYTHHQYDNYIHLQI